MTIFKKSSALKWSDLEPGYWFNDSGAIVIRCPHAKHSDKRSRIGVIQLSPPDPRYWKIDPSGKVAPSVFFTDPVCGFHDYIRLEGWAP